MSECRCGRKACRICELRKFRKKEVKRALDLEITVPYDMRTLLDDGWSVATIKKVWRAPAKDAPRPSGGDAGGDNG